MRESQKVMETLGQAAYRKQDSGISFTFPGRVLSRDTDLTAAASLAETLVLLSFWVGALGSHCVDSHT